MDSVTHIALGAAVGEAVMQNKVGRKASLWGAVCGTLPDLDVLIPLGDPVSDFTYHRAASHALFYLTLATPLISWLIMRIHPQTREHRWRWMLLVWLALVTHVLLDSFTVYGTQIFLPFSNYPVGWSTIFVIDPLYTIPLALGVLSFFWLKRSPARAYRLNVYGLVISSLYLAWSVGAHAYVNGIARDSLEKLGYGSEQLITGPAPFNTLLWRTVAMTDSGYAEGFYSLLDGDEKIRFNPYPSANHLLDPLENEWAVQRLQWFSKGFYKVGRAGDDIVLSDLRMGVEPLYFFSFAVGRVTPGKILPQFPRQVEPPEVDMAANMSRLWRRIWDKEIVLLYK
jgi:inner membrane protein